MVNKRDVKFNKNLLNFYKNFQARYCIKQHNNDIISVFMSRISL